MILSSVALALAQAFDRRFLKVLLLGLGLTVLLFALMAAVAGWGIGRLAPDTVSLPLIGQITWLGDLASAGSVLVVLVLSVFLMVPVAAVFSGLFLDDVAEAVEARHYPGLPAARRIGWGAQAADSLRFLIVVLIANLLGLVLYLISGPLAPFVFWAVNGYLLGREFFQMAALRRLDRPAAQALRRRNGGRIFLAGILVAAPLSVPVLNLAVPVIAAAAFTHIVLRMMAESGQITLPPKAGSSGGTSRDRGR